jgi:hypothetical protein
MTITTTTRFFIAMCCLPAAVPALAADLDAVKADWKADLSRYDDIVCEFLTKAAVKSGADISTQENKGVAKILGPNRLALLVEKTRTTVSVVNAKYFFEAVEGNNGGWILEAYGLLAEEQISQRLQRLDDLCGNVIALYSIANIPLYQNLDAFRVTAETDDLLTLTSTRDLESKAGSNHLRLSDITIQLDKKNRYRLISSECQQHINKSQGKMSVLYKTDHATVDSEQSTITMTETFGSGSSGLVIESTTQYKFQFSAGLKDTDFRLTAYGFVEPSGVVWQKPTPVYLWLLAAAGGFGVLALLLAYLKRQSGRQVNLHGG